MYAGSLIGFLSSFLAFVLFLSLHASVVAFARILHKAKADGTLRSTTFLESYGDTLTGGITLKGFWGTYWNLMPLVRWSFTNIVLVCLSEYPGIQMSILLAVSVGVQMGLILGKPFVETDDFLASIINELLISAYLYAMMGLSFFKSDNTQFSAVGMFLVICIGLSIVVNLAKFLYRVGRDARVALLRYFRLKRSKSKDVTVPIQPSFIKDFLHEDDAHLPTRIGNPGPSVQEFLYES